MTVLESPLAKSLIENFPYELQWDGVYSCDTIPAAMLSPEASNDKLQALIRSCHVKHLKTQFYNFKNYTLYHFAAIANRFELLAQLFKRTRPNQIDLVDSEGNSPLHLRAQHILKKNLVTDKFIKEFLELCKNKNLNCAEIKNQSDATYIAVTKTATKKKPSIAINLGPGILDPIKYQSSEVPNLEHLKSIFQKTSIPFSDWALSEDTNLKKAFNYVLSTPAATIELIRAGLLNLPDTKKVLLFSKNWSYENKIEETLFKSHALNAYLLADSYDFLKFQNYLHYFDLIIKILKDHYTRAMDACPKHPEIGMLLFTHHHFIVFHDLTMLFKQLSTYTEETHINIFKNEDHNEFFQQTKTALEANDLVKLESIKFELMRALQDYYDAIYEKVEEREKFCQKKCDDFRSLPLKLFQKP